MIGSAPTCANSGVKPRVSWQSSARIIVVIVSGDDSQLALERGSSRGAGLFSRAGPEPPLVLSWPTDLETIKKERTPTTVQNILRSRRQNPKVSPAVPLSPNRVAISIVPPSYTPTLPGVSEPATLMSFVKDSRINARVQVTFFPMKSRIRKTSVIARPWHTKFKVTLPQNADGLSRWNCRSFSSTEDINDFFLWTHRPIQGTRARAPAGPERRGQRFFTASVATTRMPRKAIPKSAA